MTGWQIEKASCVLICLLFACYCLVTVGCTHCLLLQHSYTNTQCVCARCPRMLEPGTASVHRMSLPQDFPSTQLSNVGLPLHTSPYLWYWIVVANGVGHRKEHPVFSHYCLFV